MELIIIFKKDPILSNIQPFDFFSPTNFFFSLDEFKEKIDDILENHVPSQLPDDVKAQIRGIRERSEKTRMPNK